MLEKKLKKIVEEVCLQKSESNHIEIKKGNVYFLSQIPLRE